MFVARKWESEVGTPWPKEMYERYDLIDQGLSAELIADRWGISREQLDEIAYRSHMNAARGATKAASSARSSPSTSTAP